MYLLWVIEVSHFTMNRLWQLYPHFGKVPIRTCLVSYDTIRYIIDRGFLFSFLPFNLLPAHTFQFFSTPAFQLPPASAFQLSPASTFPCILLHAIEDIHKKSCSYPPLSLQKSLSNGMALHQSSRLCPPIWKTWHSTHGAHCMRSNPSLCQCWWVWMSRVTSIRSSQQASY